MTDDAAPSARVAEVLDAYLRALEGGDPPDRDALLARHPDLAEELAAALDGLDFVRRASRALPDGSESDEEVPGRALGDYRLVREIGRGGMAVIYEAEQVSLARRVALKVLPFAAVLDPKQLQRFKNEALAAANLRHPNIVPVHGVGCERGVHYYAMQYVEGQSLAHAIRDMRGGGAGEGPRTPISSHGSNREPGYVRMAAALGVQAAGALDHAHQVGIVHRDVKPANLLVDAAGTLWITDFGLARSVQDVGLTITGELLGTVRYMSPEQTLAKRVPVDHRTDVYSLGATLYELITLEPAFPGDDPHAVIQDIVSREPVLPRRLNPAIPRDLETVLLKAMSKDPAGRYATAQEMADDLRRYLDDLPVAAKRPGPLRRAARWGRRHRAVVAAAASVLLIAVAGLTAGTALLWREKGRTDDALERADANLGLALDALDRLYLKEAEGTPTLRRGLAREMLEQGLGFYERFAEGNAGHLAGDAHHRAGLILGALGRKERANEVLDRAIAVYRAAAAVSPGDPGLHSRLGGALEARGDVEGAIEEHREALRLRPGLATAHYSLGRAFLLEGDLDGAIASFGEALRLQPDFSQAHVNLGIARHGRGETDAAIREFREAVRLAPASADAHYNLGVALGRTGDLDGAVREQREVVRLRPEYADAYVELGLALHKKGDDDGAIHANREAIRLDPDRALVHHHLANLLAAKGELREAVAEYREAIRLEPNSAHAHSDLGLALEAMRDLEGAMREFREALRLDPDLADAHFKVGCLLGARGDHDGAIREFREVLRTQPDSAGGRLNLGFGLMTMGDLDGAIHEFREAIRIRPEWAQPHGCLGAALAAKGDLDGAVRAFRDAVRLDPDDADHRDDLGLSLMRAGKNEEAILVLQETVRRSPSHASARCNLGEALMNASQVDGAIGEFRAAIRLRPDFAEAHCSLGSALMRQGRFREALPLVRRGHELGSARPGWPYPSATLLEMAQRGAALVERADRVLAGQEQPRDALDRIAIAQVLHARGLHAESASMYVEAFADTPSLAEDLQGGHRYNAACCAALAAANGGAEWRGRTLEWLRADLAARERAGAGLATMLAHWKADPDLASVRDRLAELPEPDREAWRSFWASVDAALAER